MKNKISVVYIYKDNISADWWYEELIKDVADILIIFVSSNGGDLFATSKIASLKAKYKKVITVGIGAIYSAASVVFMLGDERYIAPYSLMMFHEANVSTTGNVKDTVSYGESVDKIMRSIFTDLGINRDNVEQYYTAEEVVEKGWAKYIPKKIWDMIKRDDVRFILPSDIQDVNNEDEEMDDSLFDI